MAFERFKRKKTIGELEEEGDRLTIESENASKEADIAERRAIVSELRKRYGPSWTKILNVSKWADISTLRSFLRTAKQGMEKQTTSSGSTPINRMHSFKGITKA